MRNISKENYTKSLVSWFVFFFFRFLTIFFQILNWRFLRPGGFIDAVRSVVRYVGFLGKVWFPEEKKTKSCTFKRFKKDLKLKLDNCCKEIWKVIFHLEIKRDFLLHFFFIKAARNSLETTYTGRKPINCQIEWANFVKKG